MKRVLTVALVVVVVAGVTGPAGAQQSGDSPSVTLAGTDIQVNAGETSQVSATYRFSVASVGSGDQQLSSITGTLWKFPGRSISGISTSVNGQTVEPEVTDNAQHVSVAVPIENVGDGDTVRVRVSYEVSGPSGELRVPIWVPEYKTQGRQNVVGMTVTLPGGTQPQGDAFPNIDRRTNGGSTLQYSMLHTPSFVFTTYGSGGGGLAINTISSLAGIVFILAFFGLWVWYTRRTIGEQSGGDADVA